MTGFTADQVPDLTGKTVFITGANTGLGFEAAKVLAEKNARVLIGCRSRDKANNARSEIISLYSHADIAVVQLDLGSLASIKKAAKTVAAEPQLDILINNAGIMIPPYELTEDGFESQFGVNHLGPFALTNLLLDKLRATAGARIISTSSIAHKRGKILFDDINAERGYNTLARYAMSKLANLYFGYELQRRLSAAGDDTISVVAHPGIAETELSRYMPGPFKLIAPLLRPMMNSAAQGAWPTLCAATASDVEGGSYYGPSKRGETAGPAVPVKSTRRSHDTEVARRLWDLSLEMTGVHSGV